MRRPDLAGAAAALLVGALGLTGCGGGRALHHPDVGRAAVYAPGTPTFDLDVTATVLPDTTALDVFVSLPPTSLVFRRDDLGRYAIARTTVEVRTSDGVATTATRIDTVRAQEGDWPSVWRERVVVPPGRYLVEATVEDEATGKTFLRRAGVEVPGRTGGPSLGRIRLEGRGASDDFEPLVALGVTEAVDSLRAVAQAVGVPDGAAVRLEVLRLRSDDTVASPPSSFTLNSESLVSRGVDVRGAPVDTVQVSRQRVDLPAEAVDVVAPIAALGRGVYQIRLSVESPEGGPDGGAPLGESERLLVVRRRAFPRLTRVGDLIDPLAYLATPSELEALRSESNPYRQQRALDRFWGERMDDRRLAAATVRTYYERVEEANRQFSNQKEGWKTDRGMVYVLFGPPDYVRDQFRTETWEYVDSAVGAISFVFERSPEPTAVGLPFEVYTLVRDPSYDALWRRARSNWRRGEPL